MKMETTSSQSSRHVARKMRQKDKPWEAIGMSRASWYRHGKPSEKPPKRPREGVADLARQLGFSSTRTYQRVCRVLESDDDLAVAFLRNGLAKAGQAERLLTDPVVRRRAEQVWSRLLEERAKADVI